MAAEGRLPVELLGGFLGSGKTTLLRRRYAGAAGERAAVIVNEFGEVPLDQRMALGTGTSIRVIAGGCVCCDRRDELVQVLRQVVSDWDGGVDIDRVVIETSGVADPGPVVAAIAADPMLRHRCRVDRVTVTVDAQAGEAELGFPAELRRQIAMADELVLTKADLVTGETLERLARGLRELGSAAPIKVAVDGEEMPEPSWPGLSEAPAPAPDLDRGRRRAARGRLRRRLDLHGRAARLGRVRGLAQHAAAGPRRRRAAHEGDRQRGGRDPGGDQLRGAHGAPAGAPGGRRRSGPHRAGVRHPGRAGGAARAVAGGFSAAVGARALTASIKAARRGRFVGSVLL